MSKLQIIIPGIPPSKKNSKQIRYNRKTDRRFITSSDAHKDWHTAMMYEIKSQKINKIKGIIKLFEITFYPPDRRRHDSTNVSQSIEDLLVDCGIIEDDNWWVLQDIRLKLGGVDPENPRCEVLLIS